MISMSKIEVAGESLREAIKYVTEKIKKNDIAKINIVSSDYGVVIHVYNKENKIIRRCLMG